MTADTQPTNGAGRRRPGPPATLTHPVTGETRSVAGWAEHLGCSKALIDYRRKKGLPLEQVLAPKTTNSGPQTRARPRKGAAAPAAPSAPGRDRKRAPTGSVTGAAQVLLEACGYRVTAITVPAGVALLVAEGG